MAKTPPPPNYRHDHFGQAKVKAMLAARRHVMDRYRSQILFVCWREGASQPVSYHTDEPAARAAAFERVRAGEAICILRAEIIAVASAAEPVITMTEARP